MTLLSVGPARQETISWRHRHVLEEVLILFVIPV
jgi:hypothetical protein